jgi:hypothetical protein
MQSNPINWSIYNSNKKKFQTILNKFIFATKWQATWVKKQSCSREKKKLIPRIFFFGKTFLAEIDGILSPLLCPTKTKRKVFNYFEKICTKDNKLVITAYRKKQWVLFSFQFSIATKCAEFNVSLHIALFFSYSLIPQWQKYTQIAYIWKFASAAFTVFPIEEGWIEIFKRKIKERKKEKAFRLNFNATPSQMQKKKKIQLMDYEFIKTWIKKSS